MEQVKRDLSEVLGVVKNEFDTIRQLVQATEQNLQAIKYQGEQIRDQGKSIEAQSHSIDRLAMAISGDMESGRPGLQENYRLLSKRIDSMETEASEDRAERTQVRADVRKAALTVIGSLIVTIIIGLVGGWFYSVKASVQPHITSTQVAK